MEESETQQLGLSECFKLGKALRSGDADQFCEIYDSLVPTVAEVGGANSQFTISAIKEIARQISELSQEDYITLANCYPPYSSSNDISVDIYEPIAIQLAELIDRVRVEGQGTVTSDSGHLSDYSCETDEQKSGGSNSLLTLCGGEDSSLDEALLESHQGIFEETIVLKDTKIGTVNPLEYATDGLNHLSARKMLPAEDKIGALLCMADRVVSQDEESIHSDKAEIFTVTELEKEFFSDSSEDISPEKVAFPLPSQQDQYRYKGKAMPYRFKNKRDLQTGEGERAEESKWNHHHREYRDTSYHHSHGWNRHYSRRGGYSNNYRRPRGGRGGGGGGYRSYHQGREERNRIKEVSNIHEAQSESWTPTIKPRDSSEVRLSYKEKLIATADKKKDATTTHSKGGKLTTSPENAREKHSSENKKEKHTSSPNTSPTEKKEKPIASAKRESSSIAPPPATTENCQPLSDTTEKKPKSPAPMHYQPSPLVVHSQNMWSSNINAIKSSCCKTFKQSKNSNTSTDLFNHFEVGNFLMEEWDKAVKEFAAGGGNLL